MEENEDLFDDFLDEEANDELELALDDDDEDADDELEDADDEDVEVRTVILAKADMMALLGLKISPQGGMIVRVDPREDRPAAQVYDDATAATRWFNRSLATSRKNGWSVIYDGLPLYG